MAKLTKKELAFINRLEKAFKSKPETLKVYVVDATVTVCKIGVSCNEIDFSVGEAYPTNMLSDVHDDLDYGRPKQRLVRDVR